MTKQGRYMVQKERNTTNLVKDPEAHRLAQAIAKATGETITRAVTEALRERYERLHRRDPEALAADIRAIADPAAAYAYPSAPQRAASELPAKALAERAALLRRVSLRSVAS
jgi:antitoxin VapB